MGKFGYTKIDISDRSEAGQAVLAARALVSDAHLAGHGKDIGETHITLRYGLMDDAILQLEAFLSTQIPFQVVLGTTSSFPPSASSDEAAVIIAPVSSAALRELNDAVAEHAAFAPADFDYSPHATIAYVQPEHAEQYVGLDVTNGARCTVHEVSICMPDGSHVEVKLGGVGHRYSPDQPRDPNGEFAGGGSSESNELTSQEKEAALTKLSELQTENESDYAKAYGLESVRLSDIGMKDDGWAYAKHPASDINGEKYSRVMSVPLKDIGFSSASQSSTSLAGLKAYINRQPDPKKNGWPEVAKTPDGAYHVISGHTRLGAVMLSGRSTARARVYQYAQDGRWLKDKPSKRSVRFNKEQEREPDGTFTMGNVATFKNETKGTESFVTKYHGKFHVNATGMPSAIFSDKEKAIAQAKKLIDVRFSDDQPRDQAGKWTSSGTSVDGDVKTTTYTGATHSIVVLHNTKENKITVKHLDAKGDLLVQQTHDSVGAARKELTSQGIDHKFYALRNSAMTDLEERYSPDQPRDHDGKFASGGVSTSEFTASKNFLIAAYDKTHTSDFHENTSRYSGASTLEPPPGYVKENMIGFAQAVKQGDGSHAIQNVEVHPDFRRRGVATKMYDAAESKIGGKLVKGAVQSTDATSFWKDRDGNNRTTQAFVGPQGEPLEVRYSDDQPRDSDGKFASGGSVAGKESPEFLKPDMTDHEAKSAMVRNAARDLNFPIDKVVTDQETKEFSVGDHHYTEGGHAEIYTTGNVVIHTNHVSDDFVRGIVAHEVEHVRFQGVLKDYENEMGHLRGLPTSDPTLWDAITTPNGYLDPEKGAGAHFPTVLALQDYFDKNSVELAKEDGVSAYSKSYWEAALNPKFSNGQYPAFRDRAIHETLAEMARFKSKTPQPGDTKPTKLWNGLFKTINTLAKERGYGYNKRGR